MPAIKPQHVSKDAWERLTPDERAIFEHMPKHAQDLMLLQASAHFQYFSNLTTLMYLFLALICFIGAWQAGYSPWWFIANILKSIGIMT